MNIDTTTKATIIKDSNVTSLLDQHAVVLLDFWAPWCPPCKAITPTIDLLASEYPKGVGVGKVDIDQNKSIAEKYRITSIPTLVFLKNSEEKERLVGVHSMEAIKKILNSLLQ